MANRKKSKKSGKKSAGRKSSRKKPSESANGPSAATLVAESTVFAEEPAGPAPTASTPTPSGTTEAPLSPFLAPALRAPAPNSGTGRIVKHSPPSPGQLMQPEPKAAPKPAPRKAKREPAPKRLPLPENLTQAQIYETLAALLVPYARRMESEFHPKLGFCLKAKNARTGREAHFGGVQALADGVAFHLFPLYAHPELLEGMSPELFNRMRSKTHFHFEKLNAGMLDELVQLIREGFERFLADGMA